MAPHSIKSSCLIMNFIEMFKAFKLILKVQQAETTVATKRSPGGNHSQLW